MGADQITCEWATRRGLNLKPFAHKGCSPLVITEFRVLLVIKLSVMSPFSLFFFFEFLFVFHFCVRRIVVSFRFVLHVVFWELILLVCGTTSYEPESLGRKYSSCSRATPVHWYLWPDGGRSVCVGFSNRKDITVYRESPFVDLGLWSFKFMRIFSLSSLPYCLCHRFLFCALPVVLLLLFFSSS